MKGERVRIVSKGGMGLGTKIYMGDTEVKGVLSINISEINPEGHIVATFKVVADIDIEAEAEVTD
jgi:hypothetical protein